MNDAVNRFIQETGAGYAEDGDRDISPILFKADDESDGMLFELTLPKGEPHPYWRVRKREMTAEEIRSLAVMRAEEVLRSERPPWTIGKNVGNVGNAGPSFIIRGYVYNARLRGKWNFSVDKVD